MSPNLGILIWFDFRECWLSLGSEPFVCNFLSKNIKFEIYRTIILPIILYGCKVLSLTLREVHRLRTFGNRALRRIFGPKRDEETEKWRRLYYDELYNLNALTNVVGVIKTRRMTWMGHVSFIAAKRNEYTFSLRNTSEREYLEYMSIAGRVVLKRIFKELEAARTGLIWLRIVIDGVCSECSNQPSISIK
jgi:hypothetical protein